MKSPHFTRCVVLFALAAAGFAMEANGANAQQAGEVIEEIIIEAPRVVRHEVERTATGTKIELIQLRRRVSYADLDLTKHSDVTKLEERINTTAEQACSQLAELFPLAASDNPDCVDRAVDDAMEQMEKVVASVNE